MKNIELPEKQFFILEQIASSIAADDIRITADLMLKLCLDYTRAKRGSLMLLNDEDELTIFAAQGVARDLVKTYKAKIGEGIAGTVAQHRQPVLVKDIEKDARFRSKPKDRYSTRSFISCPIVSKDRLLGVLNINDKSDNSHFTEDEFSLIKIIANQAATALDNAFLMQGLRAKAAELESMNRKLIESDVLKTEFLVRMSHELRTPLNAINGSIYYLQQSEKISTSERKDFQNVIAAETDKLIHIVENLLDFLRLEDESRIMKKSILSLSDILHGISGLRSLRSFLDRKNIRLNIAVPKDISQFIGDQSRVSQLFMNMIEGIGYYLEKDDSIDISVHQNDFIQVRLRCSRQIPEPLIHTLFHPKNSFLTQLSEQDVRLYLAQKAVDGHNWNMSSENADDGLCICITIPKSSRQRIDAAVDSTMEMFIDFISDILGVNICSIMLSDDFTGELTIKNARGLNNEIINRTRLRIGDSIAGWVVMEGRPLFVENIETDPRFMRKNINQYDTNSLISLPLKIHDKVVGVINLNNKKSKTPFTTEDFFTASMLSERVSFFLEKLYSGDLNEGSLSRFLTSFDNLIATGKKYHKKDSLTASLIFKVMDRLGATEEERRKAVYISTIYDLGLVPINRDISKRENLTSEEKHIIKTHPHTTVSLLSDFEFSDEIKNVILHHHESYDGTGYPDGLAGEEIPFISRILHVVDAFCAMTTVKPYRRERTAKEALEEIIKHAGSLYDPAVVKALESVLTSI